MTEFLESISLFPLVLTVGSYLFGVWCQKKTKLAICNPLLICIIIVIAVLALSGFRPERYQAGMDTISWLMTPVTVCLALPLNQQLKVLKGQLPAILAGVASGTLVCLAFILVMCRLFALDSQLTVSLLPKSITTAIAIVLSGDNGGIPALTAISITITGILGNLTGSALCRLLRIESPVAQGVSFGTASHVIGTARASQIGPLTGAASTLSLTVAGLLTAVLFPFVCLFV